MSNFKGLAHINIATDDIEKSKEFYTKALGFKFEYEARIDEPNNAWLKLAFVNLNGMVIEFLEPSDKTTVKNGCDGIINHIAIEVKNIDEVMEDLKAKGIVFETEKPGYAENMFKGIKFCFFRGPSGERIELFEFLG